MKIKTLVAVLLLSGGVTSTFAQTENCNSNSSISHEAVRAGLSYTAVLHIYRCSEDFSGFLESD